MPLIISGSQGELETNPGQVTGPTYTGETTITMCVWNRTNLTFSFVCLDGANINVNVNMLKVALKNQHFTNIIYRFIFCISRSTWMGSLADVMFKIHIIGLIIKIIPYCFHPLSQSLYLTFLACLQKSPICSDWLTYPFPFFFANQLCVSEMSGS